jgi:Flp pilus assembly pilin Flp
MLIRQQAYVMSELMAIVRRGRAALASRDEQGAIPAEVAWIAGIVVLALAVIVILTTVTTGAANNIKLK